VAGDVDADFRAMQHELLVFLQRRHPNDTEDRGEEPISASNDFARGRGANAKSEEPCAAASVCEASSLRTGLHGADLVNGMCSPNNAAARGSSGRAERPCLFATRCMARSTEYISASRPQPKAKRTFRHTALSSQITFHERHAGAARSSDNGGQKDKTNASAAFVDLLGNHQGECNASKV